MEKRDFIEGELSHSVIGAFFEVYNTLGFGFSEHVHSAGMLRERTGRGHQVGREVLVNVHYKGAVLCYQRVDMIVDNKLILEINSTTNLPPTAIRQLTNYLRSTNLELEFVLHFGPQARFYRQILTNDRKPKYDL